MKLFFIVLMSLLLVSCLVEGENPEANEAKNFGNDSADSEEKPTTLYFIFWAESDNEDDLPDRLFALWLDTKTKAMSIVPIDWNSTTRRYKALDKKGNCVDHFPHATNFEYEHNKFAYTTDKGIYPRTKQLKINFELNDEGLPIGSQVEYSGPNKRSEIVTYYTKPDDRLTKKQIKKINEAKIAHVFDELRPCDERSRSEERPKATSGVGSRPLRNQ